MASDLCATRIDQLWKDFPRTAQKILLGDPPKGGEKSHVYQALVETNAVEINVAPVTELASELDITLAMLDARCVVLTRQKLGAFAIPTKSPPPPSLKDA